MKVMLVYTGLLYFYSLQAFEVIVPINSPDIGNRDIWVSDFLSHIIDLKHYGLNARGFSSFSFEIKACADASLYLTESEHIQNATSLYNIYIGAGGNAHSEIRVWRNKQPRHVVSTLRYETFLNCNVYMPFWISLNGSFLQFGKGKSTWNNLISSWNDPTSFEVNGIGIATGFGQTGKWKIPVNIVENFIGFFNNCQRTNRLADLVKYDILSVSKIFCALSCRISDICIGFNYHPSDTRCELLKFEGDTVEIHLMDVVGWDYYTKCYKETQLCIGCFF